MARKRSIGSKATPRQRVRASEESRKGDGGRGGRGGRKGGGGGSRGPRFRGFFGRWFKRLLIWGGGLALLGALVLGTAVYFAERSLPSFSELKQSQAGHRQSLLIHGQQPGSVPAIQNQKPAMWNPDQRSALTADTQRIPSPSCGPALPA